MALLRLKVTLLYKEVVLDSTETEVNSWGDTRKQTIEESQGNLRCIVEITPLK